MFEIEYKGANCIIISTKKARLVFDPKLSLVGLKNVSTNDAIEVATEARFAISNPDSRLSIDGPGEYGVADIDIKGIAARRMIDEEKDGLKSTIYRVVIDDTRIGVMGNIDHRLSDEQLEDLGVVDILIVPVGGGGYTLDAVDASKLVGMISPKVVIPIHYSDPAVKYEVPQDSLELFITELGSAPEKQSKYKFKSSQSLPAVLSVVELERS